MFSLLLGFVGNVERMELPPFSSQAAKLRASHLDEARGHDPEILCGVPVRKEDVAR